MDELKLCPFCGGNAELRSKQVNYYSGGWSYRVCCVNCGVSTKEWWNPEEVIAMWNRRVYISYAEMKNDE